MQKIHTALLSLDPVYDMIGIFGVHTKPKVYKEPGTRAFVWA